MYFDFSLIVWFNFLFLPQDLLFRVLLDPNCTWLKPRVFGLFIHYWVYIEDLYWEKVSVTDLQILRTYCSRFLKFVWEFLKRMNCA